MGGKEIQFESKTKKFSERRFSLANAQRCPEGQRQFSSNWEGPFRITDRATSEAYHLKYLLGKTVPRT